MTTKKEKTIREYIREAWQPFVKPSENSTLLYQESRHYQSNLTKERCEVTPNFDFNNKVDVLGTPCRKYGHTPFQCHQRSIYDESTLGQFQATNLNNDPFYPVQSNQNEDPFKEILNYLREQDNKLNKHDTTLGEIQASIKQLQETLDMEEEENLSNHTEESLKESNVIKEVKVEGEKAKIEEYAFHEDCIKSNDEENLLHMDEQNEAIYDTITAYSIPTHLEPPMKNVSFNQANIDRELDKLEELVFGHKMHIPPCNARNENISFNQADIDQELDELEEIIFGPKTHIPLGDMGSEECKISDIELINTNTLIPNLQGALEIQRDACRSKHVRDPLRGDEIDFIIPIFRPKVDPRILKYVNQFSFCVYKLIYFLAKKKRFWLGNFPFWKKFGSLEFMPIKTVVYAAKEFHPSLVEKARANRR